MTKAERLSKEALAAIRETYEKGDALEMLAEDPSVFGGVLGHIAALEAQLAQRDERIRKLRETLEKFAHGIVVAPMELSQRTLAADAKEGEGE